MDGLQSAIKMGVVDSSARNCSGDVISTVFDILTVEVVGLRHGDGLFWLSRTLTNSRLDVFFTFQYLSTKRPI